MSGGTRQRVVVAVYQWGFFFQWWGQGDWFRVEGNLNGATYSNILKENLEQSSGPQT